MQKMKLPGLFAEIKPEYIYIYLFLNIGYIIYIFLIII